jgi:hypothetical protein
MCKRRIQETTKMSSNVGKKYVWTRKDPVVLDTDNPIVQNTWYPLLDVQGGVRGLYLCALQQNNEVEAKNAEVELTIDGEVFTAYLNLANLKYHSVALGMTDDGNLLSCTHDAFPGYMMMGRTYYSVGFGVLITAPLECKSLAIRARLTSAVGTNQAFTALCSYDKLEAV